MAAGVGRLRTLPLTKPPGIAEAIDWASALVILGLPDLTAGSATATLGAVLKHPEDHEAVLAGGMSTVVGDA